MFMAGQTVLDVSSVFVCTKNPFGRFITRLRQTGSVGDRRRSSRARVTTARQDKFLTVTHLRRGLMPAKIRHFTLHVI